ncbi:hypothetical protein EYF80_022789 [Liparis tanakae]|uniref:Uncharacterized protein n=1 Tax=Liparis tanakae TaxID=230148 RepID=A0A4Z2HME1_9TELE|nr:hypothetical protein EYF80_022789 [Liparis tanakae]
MPGEKKESLDSPYHQRPLPDEAILVAHFSLHVEADHQLVDDHADDGAEERGEHRHQEPAVSHPAEGE